MANDDDRAAWVRQRGESAKAFHSFCHYVNLGPSRSADKAFHQHRTQCDNTQTTSGRRPKKWMQWSSAWGWPERAQAYDDSIERQAREKNIKTLVETRERHARVCAGSIQILTLPVRALLDSLGDPNVLQQLVARARASSAGVLELLNIATRCAQVLPGLIAMERLSLGMSTDAIEVEDKRDFQISDAIVKDPEAVDLAIRLLDRVAGTGPGTQKALEAGREPAEWEAVAGAVKPSKPS